MSIWNHTQSDSFLKDSAAIFLFLIVAGQEWKGKKWQLIKRLDKAKPGKLIFKT